MGLKSKKKKLPKVSVKSAKKFGKKLISEVADRNVEDSINSALSKLGKAIGQKTVEEYIQDSSGNCLVIKARSYSLKTMSKMLSGDISVSEDSVIRYRIFDAFGVERYTSRAESTITTREVQNIFDANGKKVGSIKQHLIPVSVPLLEKDVKEFTVYLGNEEICELRKSVSFGELEVIDSSRAVKFSSKEGEPIKIYYKNWLVAKLHDIPLIVKDGFRDRYVLEYDDNENEVLAILLTIAADLSGATA